MQKHLAGNAQESPGQKGTRARLRTGGDGQQRLTHRRLIIERERNDIYAPCCLKWVCSSVRERGESKSEKNLLCTMCPVYSSVWLFRLVFDLPCAFWQELHGKTFPEYDVNLRNIPALHFSFSGVGSTGAQYY